MDSETAITSMTALVEQLGFCLAYADAQGDHVLAAFISAAHETAMTRLSQLVGGR